MQGNTFTRLAVAALVSAGLLITPPTSALAHTGAGNVSADDSSADMQFTMTDGTTILARMLKPTATKTGIDSNGWPLIIHLHGGGGSRCLDDQVTRQQLADDGFVVVSFNSRGAPMSAGSGTQFSGSGVTCDDVSNTADSIDDSGYDYGGPKDSQDINDLITKIVYFFGPNHGGPGMVEPGLINKDKIAVMGASYGGGRTWWYGLPGAPCVTNSYWDCQVEAIVPQAPAIVYDKLPTTVTNYPFDKGTWSFTDLQQDAGHHGHAHPDVMAAMQEQTRSEYLGTTIDAVNANGTISNCDGTAGDADCYALSTTGSPTFAATDVGKPITVAAVGTDAGAGRAALRTVISEYVGANSVKLKANATTNTGTVKRVSWGTQAWIDQRAIVDENADIENVDKITIPTLVMASWLDRNGNWGTPVNPQIEAFKRLPSGTKRFLYLGDCFHGSPCSSANQGYQRGLIHRFLDVVVRGDTGQKVPTTSTNTTAVTTNGSTTMTLAGGSTQFTMNDIGKNISVTGAGPGGATLNTTIADVASATSITLGTAASHTGGSKTATWSCADNGPCVFYAIPTYNPVGSPADWGALKETTTWPPSGTSPYTMYLKQHSGGSTGVIEDTAPSGSDVEYKEIDNLAVRSPMQEFCDPGTYEASESYTYEDTTTSTTTQVYKVLAKIKLSSSTTRAQVALDFWIRPPSGAAVRVWHDQAISVPRAIGRSGSHSDVVSFEFQPGEAAFTIPGGYDLLVKVTTKYKYAYNAEPIPGKSRVYHKVGDASKQSTIQYWIEQ